MKQTGSNNVGHAATNNSPTGGPGITGVPRAGEVLTATTSGIADADGLENASFSYQWVRHDQVTNTDTDIPGETGSTYTVTREDRDRAIKVRVDFTDDGGNYETLTSFALLILPPVNTPATGAPAVNGTVRVGETLTAGTSGLADADGLDNATFTYQWIAGGSDIDGATGFSYNLTSSDQGQTIQVHVSFTDDAGNEETLTSGATDAVAAPEPPAKPTGLSAAVVSHDTVTLTWDNPQNDAITGYVILRRDREIHPQGTFDIITGDTGSADTTYTDDTVEPDKQYVYRIKAINGAGTSERSRLVPHRHSGSARTR